MNTQHSIALATAIDRAHKTFLRQQNTAKNSIRGEKGRGQQQAVADAAEQHWKDLQAVAGAFEDQQKRLASLMADRLDRDVAPPSTEIFVGAPYRTDTGWAHPLVLDADGRLRIVPTLTMEQCTDALRRTDLQHVVRKALERRQRALEKAGGA